jgi:hypothetical protein
MFYLSMGDLLMVGPSKRHTKQLRQTDGERFFEDRRHVEIAEDSYGRVVAFTTLNAQQRACSYA